MESNMQTPWGSIMGLLDGKVALVTGGTTGIGRVSAILFAREGAKVAVTGRRPVAGREVVEEIEKVGGEALFIEADATDVAGAKRVVDQIVSRFGRLDAASNNAGTAVAGPLTELGEKTWDLLIDGNLKSTFRVNTVNPTVIRTHSPSRASPRTPTGPSTTRTAPAPAPAGGATRARPLPRGGGAARR
ncbi:SDR family NAD(P)-dependent oxidoreductase [Nonomuraea terrae]|uniref:SDR family NAD(P)-dependent oxidoreductase n=1 Tax=Nonomuraea terrae TaxID=2530383 RepID=A0A4R4YUT1_9ACTN|nr:SDR family NAD(P)-dependent oxidoreductase [Nonomuraea terrae]